MLLVIVQAIRKQPLTVYGDGKQTRSFQYVSDLVWHIDFCNFSIEPPSEYASLKNIIDAFAFFWLHLRLTDCKLN